MILFTDGFYCRNEQDARFLKSSVLFNAIHGTTQIHIEGKLVEVLNELIVLMNEEAEKSKDSRQSEIIQNFLHNFLLLSEREQSHQPTSERAKGPDYELVLLFKDLLECGFLQRRLISDYAREMFVTEKRLNQATSKILGKTAKAVTNDRMVLEAKRLLSHTAKSIKEISYSLGFEEPTNFIKYFRKHNGLTPVEFREKYAIK
jgi:AraC-like DNA-binding protein